MEYAHTCYRVFDLEKAVDFYTNGLGFVEQRRFPIREGGSRLCFVRDPDGYRIELIEQGI